MAEAGDLAVLLSDAGMLSTRMYFGFSFDGRRDPAFCAVVPESMEVNDCLASPTNWNHFCSGLELGVAVFRFRLGECWPRIK